MLKRIAGGILILFIICSRENFCEGVSFCYVPRVLFTIPYGSKDAQVMIGFGADMVPHGPSGFWVDKDGDIYINDIVNRKIKKFSKDGNLIFVTEGEFYIGAFVVDDYGNIFADTGLNRTTKFDNKGKVVHHLNWSPFYERRHSKDVRKSMKDLSPQLAEIPSFKPRALIDAQDKRYEVRYEDYYEKDKETKTIVNVYDKMGKTIGTFTISPKVKKQLLQTFPKGDSSQTNLPDYEGLCTQGISIEWIDANGNLYGKAEAKRKEPIVLVKDVHLWGEGGEVVEDLTIICDEIIYKYDSQGNFITQIRYPGNICGLEQHGKVDKDGNIYCLQFHKDGMDVVKYEWKPVVNEKK